MRNFIKTKKFVEVAIAIIFILIGAFSRLFPHPPNFTPIAAIALFGGVYLSKRLAFILPIAMMLISDLFLGFYEIKLMIFVYVCFIISILLGFWLKNHKKWQTIFGASILASLIFFIFTNFAVFAFTPWYSKDFSGLIQCYFMALPFFRNTLLGDLFYVSLFFGIYELAAILVREKLKTGLKQERAC